MPGQEEDGIEPIQQGLATTRATRAEVLRPYLLALLAEAYRKTGQGDEGLTALAEALAVVNRTQERWDEAELYRVNGKMALQKSSVQGLVSNILTEAEECFSKVIEIARRQQAKSLKLRATMSLCRLWKQQGKKEAARQMLAEFHGWFTEVRYPRSQRREGVARGIESLSHLIIDPVNQ